MCVCVFTSEVNICLWNSRSMVNKLNLFQLFLSFSDYQIYAITESWCSFFVLDNEIITPNFSIFNKDCGSRSGDVFLVVQESITSRLIPSPASLEIVSAEVLSTRPMFFAWSTSYLVQLLTMSL